MKIVDLPIESYSIFKDNDISTSFKDKFNKKYSD